MPSINPERIKAEFLKLVQIDSPSFKEGKIAAYLIEKLKSLGLDACTDDAGIKTGGETGNVLGRLAANTPNSMTVFFSAHMDNVPPCIGIKPVVTGTLVKSSGDTVLGADDKAGVAAIIEMLTVLKESGAPHGEIEILFDIAEEKGLEGVRYLDLSKIKSSIGYVLDGHEISEIGVKAPSAYRMTYRVKGRASHAGVEPENGISAIVVAARAIARMKLGRIDDETTANVGVIDGGSATNIITPEVFLRAEARSHNREKLEKQVESMKEAFTSILDEFAVTVEGKTYKPEFIEERVLEYSSVDVKTDSPAYVFAQQAAREMGVEVRPHVSGGGTDANILNQSGMAAVVLGVGMDKVHTVDEYVDLKDIEKAAQLITNIAVKTAGAK